MGMRHRPPPRHHIGLRVCMHACTCTLQAMQLEEAGCGLPYCTHVSGRFCHTMRCCCVLG